MSLPLLTHLAYGIDEKGEHPGGGHCAGLGGNGPEQNRRAMVDQYVNALDVLVGGALATGDGWSLSRPILFITHQLCELVLNFVLERKGLKPGARHSLNIRMRAAIDGGALDHLSDEEQRWCSAFIQTIIPITGDGFPGRYADALVDGVQLDERWCCVNPGALRDATISFAAICVIDPSDTN